MWRWIFPTLPLTRSAEVFLFPIGSTTVVYQRIASAVGTMNRDRYHATFHLSPVSCSYSLTSFPFGHYPRAVWFEKALAAGLHSTPHAGETVGPPGIWGALQTLGAERIGHRDRARKPRPFMAGRNSPPQRRYYLAKRRGKHPAYLESA